MTPYGGYRGQPGLRLQFSHLSDHDITCPGCPVESLKHTSCNLLLAVILHLVD